MRLRAVLREISAQTYAVRAEDAAQLRASKGAYDDAAWFALAIMLKLADTA
jgi:hypothetical protein